MYYKSEQFEIIKKNELNSTISGLTTTYRLKIKIHHIKSH